MNDYLHDDYRRLWEAMIPVVHNPQQHIQYLMPHYTNDAFKTAQTVYLATDHRVTPAGGYEYVRGATYNYSDRLYQWHTEAHEGAVATMRENHDNTQTAAACETYLRTLLNNPDLRLVHILAGFNLATGYPYRVYGYFTGGNES